MTRANKALAIFVVASLGLWGCAQGPANGPGSAERIRALESKIAKIEDDFRAAVAARDQLRKKVTTVEEQHAQQTTEVQNLTKERDELRLQLGSRTGERDALQVQFDMFRKNLRNLLGQAEGTAGTTAPPMTSTTALPLPGNF